MRKLVATLVLTAIIVSGRAFAQLDTDGPGATLRVNGLDPSQVDPLDHYVFVGTDGYATMTIGSGSTRFAPLLLLGSTAELDGGNILPTPWGGCIDVGSPGNGNLFPGITDVFALVDGFGFAPTTVFGTRNGPAGMTGQNAQMTLTLPMAVQVPGGNPSSIPTIFGLGSVPLRMAVQAVVADPTNGPLELDNTQAAFISPGINDVLTIPDDGYTSICFPAYLEFPFHNVSYGMINVHANGYVTFGTLPTGYVDPGIGIDARAWAGGPSSPNAPPSIAVLLADWLPSPQPGLGVLYQLNGTTCRLTWGSPNIYPTGGMSHFGDNDVNWFSLEMQLGNAAVNPAAGDFVLNYNLIDRSAVTQNGSGVIGHTPGGIATSGSIVNAALKCVQVAPVGDVMVEEHNKFGENSSVIGNGCNQFLPGCVSTVSRINEVATYEGYYLEFDAMYAAAPIGPAPIVPAFFPPAAPTMISYTDKGAGKQTTTTASGPCKNEVAGTGRIDRRSTIPKGAAAGTSDSIMTNGCVYLAIYCNKLEHIGPACTISFTHPSNGLSTTINYNPNVPAGPRIVGVFVKPEDRIPVASDVQIRLLPAYVSGSTTVVDANVMQPPLEQYEGLNSYQALIFEAPDLTNYVDQGRVDISVFFGSVVSGVNNFVMLPDVPVDVSTYALRDDGVIAFPLAATNGIPFGGATYDHVYVSANGLATFFDGVADFSPTLSELYGGWGSSTPNPGVAAYWTDLNPNGLNGNSRVEIYENTMTGSTKITWVAQDYWAPSINGVPQTNGPAGEFSVEFNYNPMFQESVKFDYQSLIPASTGNAMVVCGVTDGTNSGGVNKTRNGMTPFSTSVNYANMAMMGSVFSIGWTFPATSPPASVGPSGSTIEFLRSASVGPYQWLVQ